MKITKSDLQNFLQEYHSKKAKEKNKQLLSHLFSREALAIKKLKKINNQIKNWKNNDELSEEIIEKIQNLINDYKETSGIVYETLCAIEKYLHKKYIFLIAGAARSDDEKNHMVLDTISLSQEKKCDYFDCFNYTPEEYATECEKSKVLLCEEEIINNIYTNKFIRYLECHAISTVYALVDENQARIINKIGTVKITNSNILNYSQVEITLNNDRNVAVHAVAGQQSEDLYNKFVTIVENNEHRNVMRTSPAFVIKKPDFSVKSIRNTGKVISVTGN